MNTDSTTIHVPVLLEEVLTALNPQPGQHLVDGTAGGGGHLQRLAERVGPDGWVLGIDRDPRAIERLQTRLAGSPVKVACGNYTEMPTFLEEIGVPQVDEVLL